MEQVSNKPSVKFDEELSIVELFGRMCEKIRSACFDRTRTDSVTLYEEIMNDVNVIRPIVYKTEFAKYYSAGIETMKDAFTQRITSKKEDTKPENTNIIRIDDYKDLKNRNNDN